ncbi:MAG: hypothetical protein AVDCRST_MAG59-2054 [uncultured Thermomicrobiales bacterium]|uniref:Uncharacterized protein n=1 Tax=uncultured Thermomicrobiales bacterium TaxID=1645740 RepID=A0A6J4UM22_9BACT|nr:MAG: hypothetical protein AVDCRST_MAG59-2054 [uncultured Thermomicrobiales bacterium]
MFLIGPCMARSELVADRPAHPKQGEHVGRAYAPTDPSQGAL